MGDAPMTNEVVEKFEKHVRAAGFLSLGSENKRLLAQFHQWFLAHEMSKCSGHEWFEGACVHCGDPAPKQHPHVEPNVTAPGVLEPRGGTVTNEQIAKLLLECENEFMWCESHWGSDYTDIRARLKAAAAEVQSSAEPKAPPVCSKCGRVGVAGQSFFCCNTVNQQAEPCGDQGHTVSVPGCPLCAERDALNR